MTSKSKTKAIDKEEEKRVNDIINALKSEGLFDQFRKECLADVDTKPAYQNLRQRVEGYVSRFLSRQQWSPSLNKNQLRDNLRKQITASGMLANGVERVIEQVINPKIMQLIKPKIDDVVCVHLGIDPKERKEKIEAKKQEQKQNLQSLMSINLSQAEQSQSNTPNSSFQEQTTGTSFSSPYSQAAWSQQMPPQVAFCGLMPNFPMVPPFGGFPYGMPPQMFPYWNNYMYPQPMPGIPGIPFPPPMTSTAETPTVTSAQFDVSPIPPVPTTPTAGAQTDTVDTPTPPKSSLPPLPPTPPPPGTEDVPVDLPKEEKKDDVTKSLFTSNADDIPKVLDDIPLPPVSTKSEKMERLEHPEGDSQDEESRDNRRPYRFAWDEDLDVDKKSDITISSVHTSDLSSFEDFEGESNDDLFGSDTEEFDKGEIEAPQGSPLSAMGDDEMSENLTEIETAEVLPVTATELETAEKGPGMIGMIQSPVKQTKEEELSPNKPRKLISLQYNYSDDEDEETREDRKSRIAKEKEERYVKRALRRAELEAKRKEREEEKARLREERKKSHEQKEDDSFDKAQAGCTEKANKSDSLEETSPDKVPSSPEKKKRKTKEELKMELKEQKVMEKKLALRRQRTRNRRYTSDEFTSIFTEKKQPFSSQNYSEVVFEEPAIEETVVTDNIEFIVEDSQSQTGYQSQEMCETMEGEVILEDGRQLKVEVYMEDMISSPATPTQDESYQEGKPEDSTNLYEENSVSSNLKSSVEDIKSAVSPLSDVSDESLTELPKSSKRKKRTPESVKNERESKKSQRYDPTDLYKPRPMISGSRRRSSPGAATEKTDSQQEFKREGAGDASTSSSRVSKDSKSSNTSRSRSRSLDSDCQPSPISSSSLASVDDERSSYSRSGSQSSSSSEQNTRSRSRSSSGSSVDEFGRRKRRKGKMPIDMIDFGEAERMIEKKLYRVSFGEAERRAATRRIKGRGRGAMTRGSWQRQNSWQFPEGGSSTSWSPPGSPTKRYYFPDGGRSPSPTSPMQELSPGIPRRASPIWDARSESPPFYPTNRGRRSSSQIEDSPPRRPQYAVGRRPQSPPPEYLRRSLSPSEHLSRGHHSPPWGRESSMSPPRLRGHRSPSPPYTLSRITPSPPPYVLRGQRSPSPIGRIYPRGGRSPSPYRTGIRVQRSPSPSLSRGAHSPSPPFYRGSPPHRSLSRARSPSPPYLMRRTPSPPHRPITRGQRSPSPPSHRRPVSPPSKPLTRGQSLASPHDLRKKQGVSPKVPMTNKLRNIKFGSPFQQQTGSRRQRQQSPTERLPNKRGRH